MVEEVDDCDCYKNIDANLESVVKNGGCRNHIHMVIKPRDLKW